MSESTRIVDSSLRWASIEPRGKEHAWRCGSPFPERDDAIWSTLCRPRWYYPIRALSPLSDAPSGGLHGPCLNSACRHGLRLWVGFDRERAS